MVFRNLKIGRKTMTDEKQITLNDLSNLTMEIQRIAEDLINRVDQVYDQFAEEL